MSKAEIRKQMISRRDAISEGERVKLSGRIAERLFAMNEYKNATTVLSYASFRSEVITDEINRRVIADGKKLFLPKTYVKEQKMRFFQVSDLEADLVSGAMGIREPVEDSGAEFRCRREEAVDTGVQTESDNVEDILVIVPGVAFDDDGNRMGYGGGFYDRFFAEYSILASRSIFPAYKAQRAESLPVDGNDIKPKLILTEEGFL